MAESSGAAACHLFMNSKIILICFDAVKRPVLCKVLMPCLKLVTMFYSESDPQSPVAVYCTMTLK